MKLLIKYLKETCVAPEIMLPTQRSRQFPKPEKSVIFGILANGGPHDIFYVKWGFLESLNLQKFPNWEKPAFYRNWML